MLSTILGAYPKPQAGQLAGTLEGSFEFFPASSLGLGASSFEQLVACTVMPTKIAPSNAFGSFIVIQIVFG
jgi:hypothetical protein